MIQSKLRRFAVPGTLLFAISLGCQTLAASTIYVGACGTPHQSTIQAAVNASASGGTVIICPGVYPEQVTIAKNLTVTGLQTGNADSVVIASPAAGVVTNSADLYPPAPMAVAAQVLVQNATNVTLSNITVDGSANGIGTCALDLRGIYYQNASGTITSVVTRNQALVATLNGCQAGQGIFVQSGYTKGTAVVTIQGNSVHSFQKNGITADGPGAVATVANNYISGQGPTTGAAENGVQISDGAGGTVVNNVVIDEIWAPDTSADSGDAAAGILIYSSENILIQGNTVGTTQFGIVTVSDPTSGTVRNPLGLADHTTILGNQVLNTLIFDAIDVCSNNNTIESNAVFNATESGIHLDSACGTTGNGNTVSLNTITEACAGILEGGTKPNVSVAGNIFHDVVNQTLAGNVCPVTPVAATAALTLTPLNSTGSGTARPSPAR